MIKLITFTAAALVGIAASFPMAANAGVGIDSILQPLSDPKECRRAWGQSAASNSCDLVHAGDANQERCNLITHCRKANGENNTNSRTFFLRYVPRLQNCDGILQLGSC